MCPLTRCAARAGGHASKSLVCLMEIATLHAKRAQSQQLFSSQRLWTEALMAQPKSDLVNFDKFVAALPVRIRELRKPNDLRHWFDELDVTKSGLISMGAFFKWSMSPESIVAGSGAKRFFMRFNVDGSGCLDVHQFSRAVESLGIEPGSVNAQEIFQELDRDHLDKKSDGFLDYAEVLATIDGMSDEETTNFLSANVRDLFLIMCWDTTKDHEHIDTSSWSFTADSAAGVKRELCRLVKLHSVKLSHLFNQADKNSDFVCSYGEFLSMMEGTRLHAHFRRSPSH